MSEKYWLDVWQERDRLIIVLYDNENNELASWIDEEAEAMFVDGFFNHRNLKESVIEYYESMQK